MLIITGEDVLLGPAVLLRPILFALRRHGKHMCQEHAPHLLAPYSSAPSRIRRWLLFYSLHILICLPKNQAFFLSDQCALAQGGVRIKGTRISNMHLYRSTIYALGIFSWVSRTYVLNN